MGFVANILGLDGGPSTSSGTPLVAPTTNLQFYGPNPYSSTLASSLQSSLSQVAPPTALQAGTSNFTPDAYKAKDMSTAALPEYDAMRKRLDMQYSQGQGQAQDALDRQFAASGGGPGNGAEAKQTENLAANTAKQKDQDMQAVEAQEGQARTALQQQESQKEFQSGEAQKGLKFQAEQGDLSRAQQTGEFNAQMQQNYGQFKYGADAATAGKVADLNTAWDSSEAEANNNAFNAELARYQASHSGGLLGGGGFLGTGLLNFSGGGGFGF